VRLLRHVSRAFTVPLLQLPKDPNVQIYFIFSICMAVCGNIYMFLSIVVLLYERRVLPTPRGIPRVLGERLAQRPKPRLQQQQLAAARLKPVQPPSTGTFSSALAHRARATHPPNSIEIQVEIVFNNTELTADFSNRSLNQSSRYPRIRAYTMNRMF
jgi:hypothetical protein